MVVLWSHAGARAHAGPGSIAATKGRIPVIRHVLDRLLGNAEAGQGLAEYALILALIAIVAIVSLLFLGGQISGFLNDVGQAV